MRAVFQRHAFKCFECFGKEEKHMSTYSKAELLSPCGNMECVKAAVNNGADAIYIGGKQFSARQYAGNFSIQEISEVCDYCHLRNVKVYLTVNTLYKDKELNELLKFVASVYEAGVDALIVQDMGAAMLIKKNFPKFPLHASTQLTANCVEDVKALENAGFERVVLSRELSAEEIKDITENCHVPVETFIHGALCVSYSGQCLMSSMLGGRSGNRGRCAQTCRLPFALYGGYKKIREGHLLSTKDIETITILPEILKAGVSSLKIEGRMKSAEYVAGVTQIYRKYIDLFYENPEGYAVEEKDIKILTQLFNRGGFGEGYYNTHSGFSMMSVERPKSWGLKAGIVDSYDKKYGRTSIRTREPFVPGDGIEIWTQSEPHAGSNVNKASRAGEVISMIIKGDINKNDVVYKTHDKALYDSLGATYQKDTRTKNVYGYFTAYAGKPMTLKLWDMEGSSVYVAGDEVQEASNQPLSEEKLKTQLSKLGGTSFKMAELTVDCGDNIYVGASSLNKLRRDAVSELEKKIISAGKRKHIDVSQKAEIKKERPVFGKKLNVQVNNMLQFEAAVTCDDINILYFDINNDFEDNFEEIRLKTRRNGIKLYAVMPRVYRKYTEEIFGDFIEKLKTSSIDGFLVRSSGQMDMLKNCGKDLAVDYSTNVFNAEGVEAWKQKGAKSICLSPELNLSEIKNMADAFCEMLVYGHIPLMVTHQCPIGNYAGEKENHMYCKKRWTQDDYYLKDRKGEEFPLMPECEQCVCYVLNGKPLFTLKFFDEILESPTSSVRLIFTKEDAAKTDRIISAYSQMIKNPDKPSPAVRHLITEMGENGSTKGHYFRGVE